ncbi:hypothetical protein C8F01DRAFT_1079730 [Mycena amicta]|nr:hypothetical protein C8F01DRAFT_1079730 [Mycena amicta]
MPSRFFRSSSVQYFIVHVPEQLVVVAFVATCQAGYAVRPILLIARVLLDNQEPVVSKAAHDVLDLQPIAHSEASRKNISLEIVLQLDEGHVREFSLNVLDGGENGVKVEPVGAGIAAMVREELIIAVSKIDAGACGKCEDASEGGKEYGTKIASLSEEIKVRAVCISVRRVCPKKCRHVRNFRRPSSGTSPSMIKSGV